MTSSSLRRSVALVVLVGLSSIGADRAAAAADPWRIDDLLPDRVSLKLASRVRYEALVNRFRIGTSGDEDILVLRTLLDGRFDVTEQLTIGAELMDSRAYFEDGVVSTGVVNAVELLRAYGEVRLPGPFGGSSVLQGGRLTLDVGSRRFVARNRFRNTINGFTGIDWRWQGEGKREARAFWALPVLRLPFDPDDAGHNKVEFDEESIRRQFWGLFLGDDLPGEHRGELFLFGVHERDAPNRPTRNRQLVTPGLRLWKPAVAGKLDYMLESVLQVGESRASFLADRDLDHFAHFHHVEVGFLFDAPGKPRLLAQFDYASGDRDPDDSRNGRFDTLFGARRFDFGPTGIYGPFFRANLMTPGLRLGLTPTPTVSVVTALRGFWLAEKRDAWVGTGLRDRTGDSGRYLGTQLEIRVRWELRPGNLQLEGGFAHLFTGGFRDDAPFSNGQGDPSYFYLALTAKL